MPDRMSEETSDRMPDKMPDRMSDQMADFQLVGIFPSPRWTDAPHFTRCLESGEWEGIVVNASTAG